MYVYHNSYPFVQFKFSVYGHTYWTYTSVLQCSHTSVSSCEECGYNHEDWPCATSKNRKSLTQHGISYPSDLCRRPVQTPSQAGSACPCVPQLRQGVRACDLIQFSTHLQSYFFNDDVFDFNYVQAKAATGNFQEAEEVGKPRGCSVLDMWCVASGLPPHQLWEHKEWLMGILNAVVYGWSRRQFRKAVSINRMCFSRNSHGVTSARYESLNNAGACARGSRVSTLKLGGNTHTS